MRDPHLLLPLSSSPRSHVHQQCSRNPLGTLQKLLSDGSYTRLKELTFTRRLLAGDGAMHEWVIANIPRACRSNPSLCCSRETCCIDLTDKIGRASCRERV